MGEVPAAKDFRSDLGLPIGGEKTIQLLQEHFCSEGAKEQPTGPEETAALGQRHEGASISPWT